MSEWKIIWVEEDMGRGEPRWCSVAEKEEDGGRLGETHGWGVCPWLKESQFSFW